MYHGLSWPQLSYVAEDDKGKIVGYVLAKVWLKLNKKFLAFNISRWKRSRFGQGLAKTDHFKI